MLGRGTGLFLDDFLLHFHPSACAAFRLQPPRIGVFPRPTPSFLGMLMKFTLCSLLADPDSDCRLRWHLIYPEMRGCWSLQSLFATARNIWKGEGREIMIAESLRLMSVSKGCKGRWERQALAISHPFHLPSLSLKIYKKREHTHNL